MVDEVICKKVTYSSQIAAELFIEKYKRTARLKKTPRTYLCPFCDLWHITYKDDKHRKEVKKLEAKIKSLEARIKELEDPMIREIQSEAMTNKMARVYQKTITEKNVIIKTLRGDNRKLIEEIISLRKKIEL